MKILVISEKPSVGKSIAAVLGAKERKDGYYEGNGYIVSWCIGHLVGLAQADTYNEKYGKWRYEDLPIVPQNWQYTVAPDKKKQVKILADLMKRADVDSVINACDAGREGELIFRLVYNFCGCKKPIQRLWISSMEESAITNGFNSLKSGDEYETLYQSALCRSQADWLVGINATRLFSTIYRQTLTVGRVQTPTLALLVQRKSDIENFIKEPFYTVELNCNELTVSGEKVKDKAFAETIRNACDRKSAVIKSVERKEKAAACPKLYDLTTLQREANRLFGYTAQQTLDYAQALYEKKLTTYPRVDSRYLTEDMAAGLPTLVLSVMDTLTFLKLSNKITNPAQVIDNTKVSDHHAIIPTPTMTKTDLSALPVGERNILHMLAVRLICAVGEKHTYAETVVTVDCEGNIFTTKGKIVLQDGWKGIEQAFKGTLKDKPKEDEVERKSLLEVADNQAFAPVSATLKEGFTSPAKPFTEDTLLSSMETAGAEDMPEDSERKGLGTPATRAGIIERLVKTGVIERKQKNLIATQKGVNLITVLPDAVKSPTLTAEWEHKLGQIQRGELSSNDFMVSIEEMTSELVKSNSTPNAEYMALFPAPTFSSSGGKGEVIGKCPSCGKNVIEGNKGFFCENRACGFALWKENKYFGSMKKELNKTTATALLKEGRIFMSGLHSQKSGKTFSATIILNVSKDDNGKAKTTFTMEFPKSKGGKK